MKAQNVHISICSGHFISFEYSCNRTLTFQQGVNQKVSESFNQGNESVDSDSGLETCKQKGIHPNLLAVSFKNTPGEQLLRWKEIAMLY